MFSLTGIGQDMYVKRPKFMSYYWASGTKELRRRFTEVACTLDIMRRNPHPNVVSLEGYDVRGGRISGLVVKRYPVTLRDWIKNQDDKSPTKEPLDKVSAFKAILGGVAHIHSLGIAHNDLNPSNIMLDEDDHPVIIDLGSCKAFGEVLTEGGPPKWNEGFEEVSTV